MSALACIATRLALARKRHALKSIDVWIATLEDQVRSGEASLVHHVAKRRRLQAEIYALETPREILRRAGARA